MESITSQIRHIICQDVITSSLRVHRTCYCNFWANVSINVIRCCGAWISISGTDYSGIFWFSIEGNDWCNRVRCRNEWFFWCCDFLNQCDLRRLLRALVMTFQSSSVDLTLEGLCGELIMSGSVCVSRFLFLVLGVLIRYLCWLCTLGYLFRVLWVLIPRAFYYLFRVKLSVLSVKISKPFCVFFF